MFGANPNSEIKVPTITYVNPIHSLKDALPGELPESEYTTVKKRT